VLDDAYNANADSMLAALQTLQDLPCSGHRVAMLGDMQAHAPALAFAAALDVVRPHLSEREWAKLSASLKLPPVPGLVQA